jgi:curved DNA-binding protein CbpA
VDVSRAYAILGLGPGASADDVRNAYRGAIRRLHPDTGSGDVRAFMRAASAYRTIESVLPARPAALAASEVPVRHVDVYA